MKKDDWKEIFDIYYEQKSEISILKYDIEKLREENARLREELAECTPVSAQMTE